LASSLNRCVATKVELVVLLVFAVRVY